MLIPISFLFSHGHLPGATWSATMGGSLLGWNKWGNFDSRLIRAGNLSRMGYEGNNPGYVPGRRPVSMAHDCIVTQSSASEEGGGASRLLEG